MLAPKASKLPTKFEAGEKSEDAQSHAGQI
jgi:hypothetical protein